MKICVESDHDRSLLSSEGKYLLVLSLLHGKFRDVPAFVAQLTGRERRIGGNSLVQKKLDRGQIGPAHAADVS
jgi:hypothetical protein